MDVTEKGKQLQASIRAQYVMDELTWQFFLNRRVWTIEKAAAIVLGFDPDKIQKAIEDGTCLDIDKLTNENFQRRLNDLATVKDNREVSAKFKLLEGIYYINPKDLYEILTDYDVLNRPSLAQPIVDRFSEKRERSAVRSAQAWANAVPGELISPESPEGETRERPEHAPEAWISNKEAAELMMKNFTVASFQSAKARVSKACKQGEIKSRKKSKGRGLEVEKGSLLLWIEELKKRKEGRYDPLEVNDVK